MEGFVEHKGAFWRIQGHVLMVQAESLVHLMDNVAHSLMMPWAFSVEGEHYQFTHPLTMREREEHAWLYHRMEALNKTVDNEPEPPHNPGPQAA
ncbi:hypothetical protein KoPa4_00044 [Pseudomonas phage vB_PpuM-KoPa-4]|uniref:Uncharacterized protein n=1 Tax=Pseudomonas phage vB_PpuM-KoPa-4 TaxID=3132618 RepID=A0AAX4MWR4_9CAUD